ncbi:hypothetical protein EBAPG3_012915 [Nitrosospira lacus]|uniref:Schlafen AlbA-2 domain-containing protein n=1 Tax=Nitrosospira lacus TaxID=1288494 RepID=A0A1W6SS28_9PROT|nr:ATP-binding protein [Nitrosospira lacus]ARO88596.1 hypothetical protein EBAPG3_012915 [Nitrosospira lacus]
MSITRTDFDAICEADLAELVAGQVPEGLHLDYKRDSYGPRDEDKRELLKDVSAFANANGGHIVIGLDETEGVASQLYGIKTADIDVEVSRLDQIVRTGLEPRIPGIRVRAIPLESQSHAIVVRVPRSWRLPHRVCAQNSNRFWIRNSAGAHEASMDELRHLFTLSASAIDRARAFRAERMGHITSGAGAVPLTGNGRFILHIIPLSAVASTATLDAKQIYPHVDAFRPLASSGFSPRYNLDGVISECGGVVGLGYTQLFRNGVIEAVICNLVHASNGRNGIAGLRLEKNIFSLLSGYINGLNTVGIEPPLILMFTLEGVEGAYYHVIDQFRDEQIPFDRPVVALPECYIEDFGSDADYHRAVKPAFDALWNAVGLDGSRFFDKETGLWNGR